MAIHQEQQPPAAPVQERTSGFSFCALVQAMRPRQWTKNGFVLLAVMFGHRLGDPKSLLHTLGAFLIFCFLSSSVYLINDIADVEKDRQHPTKRRRPIASGRLSIPAALLAAVLAGEAWSRRSCCRRACHRRPLRAAWRGLVAAFLLMWPFAAIAVGYLVLNLAYSFRLKHVVIVDVLCIAIFFVLRAAAGAAAIQVVISHWLLICTDSLALFIALSKRRHELVLLTNNASHHRGTPGGVQPLPLGPDDRGGHGFHPHGLYSLYCGPPNRG